MSTFPHKLKVLLILSLTPLAQLIQLGLAILNASAENSITVALRASPVSGAHTASYRVDKEAGDQAREQGVAAGQE